MQRRGAADEREAVRDTLVVHANTTRKEALLAETVPDRDEVTLLIIKQQWMDVAHVEVEGLVKEIAATVAVGSEAAYQPVIHSDAMK